MRDIIFTSISRFTALGNGITAFNKNFDMEFLLDLEVLRSSLSVFEQTGLWMYVHVDIPVHKT